MKTLVKSYRELFTPAIIDIIRPKFPGINEYLQDANVLGEAGTDNRTGGTTSARMAGRADLRSLEHQGRLSGTTLSNPVNYIFLAKAMTAHTQGICFNYFKLMHEIGHLQEFGRQLTAQEKRDPLNANKTKITFLEDVKKAQLEGGDSVILDVYNRFKDVRWGGTLVWPFRGASKAKKDFANKYKDNFNKGLYDTVYNYSRSMRDRYIDGARSADYTAFESESSFSIGDDSDEDSE